VLVNVIIDSAPVLSGKGFLGTGAPLKADLNLVAQFVMALALIAGAVLAKRKRYTAHGICQTTVLLLNLVAIGLVMLPSFQQANPTLPRILHRWLYTVAAIHALLGIAAELLGLYIVVVAGTKLLPQRLCVQNWKLCMRTELILWCVVMVTGVGTYCAWYVTQYR